MSKRLKRRILDICGLNNLSREDRVRKANAILSDAEAKQKICNEIVGASHRDVEKALKDLVITKTSKEDEEMAELEREHPEKLDPDLIPVVRKKKALKLVPVTNKAEVNKLINATSQPLEDKVEVRENYSTYSSGDISELLGRDDGTARVRQDQTEE